MSEWTVPVLLYDGQCALCNFTVQFTLRNERHSLTRFVAVQSTEGRKICLAQRIDPDDPSTVLFLENGEVHARSDAVVALARHLRAPACWLKCLKLVPKPVRDMIYRFVARHRYAFFGRYDLCPVPPPAMAERFCLPETRP